MVGARAHASYLAFEERPRIQGTVIYSGLLPYFGFSVLYDPEHGEVGLKPVRPPTAARGGCSPAVLEGVL